MDAKQLAVQSCSCPRVETDTLAAPRCPVESTAGWDSCVLFVRMDPGLFCKRALPFGSSQICLCENRLKVFLEHSI